MPTGLGESNICLEKTSWMYPEWLKMMGKYPPGENTSPAGLFCNYLLYRAETVFADAAFRADPVFRNIFEFCSRFNAVIRIADCRVIDVATNITYKFLHSHSPCWVF